MIEDEDGKHAVSVEGILSVPLDGKVFFRNALKSGHRHVRMLVGELDGVRCYVLGTRVILSKKDLYL